MWIPPQVKTYARRLDLHSDLPRSRLGYGTILDDQGLTELADHRCTHLLLLVRPYFHLTDGMQARSTYESGDVMEGAGGPWADGPTGVLSA
jgi:hypothetical protein